jgi:hypothetical protein
VLVAQPAAAALEQLHDLPVARHVAQELARLGVIHGRAARHLDGAVLAILARALVLIARLAVGGNDVAGVLQVNERPQVGVALQVHVAATAAVAAVGTALGHVLGAVQVGRAAAAVAAAAQYLHIVDEIGFCHNSFLIGSACCCNAVAKLRIFCDITASPTPCHGQAGINCCPKPRK